MLDYYLQTVVIYFLIYIGSGIALHKQFKIAQKKLKKALNDKTKTVGNIRTTIFYFFISFVPVVRFLFLYGKIYLIFNPEDTIRRIKKKEAKKC